MAQQAPRPSTRELRQTFGVLYDQAAELAASLRACGCGAGDHAEDGQDLDAMVEELLAVRQRVGGCICGPPCDGTSVDDVSKEFLDAMLARLEWQAAVLDEDFQECGCPERQEVESPEPVHVPRTLMSLPAEIRGMIWWRTLANNPGLVRIMPRQVYLGRPLSNTSFHPQARFSVGGLNNQRWTYERAGEEAMEDGFALLHVNREIYQEADAEFWRRVINDNVMLSFGPPLQVSDQDYRFHGIIAAYTFFVDRSAEFLRGIRRVHLDLRYRGGVNEQALEVRNTMGTTNWGEYMDRLLDLIRTDLTGLRHLSLTIGGYVPDMRQTPWVENFPGINPFRTPQSSQHWVTRLQSIVGLTRLRLRVVIPNRLPTGVLVNPDVQRTFYFLRVMRSSMLVNGDALGGRGNWSMEVYRPGLPRRIIVQTDMSWDEETGRHIDHDGEDYDYDPDSDYNTRPLREL